MEQKWDEPHGLLIPNVDVERKHVLREKSKAITLDIGTGIVETSVEYLFGVRTVLATHPPHPSLE